MVLGGAYPVLPERRITILGKLGVTFSSSTGYKLPSGKTFSRDAEMRSYLLKHGIPNMSLLSAMEYTLLKRWVTFAHVPVNHSNSVVKLMNVEVLTDDDASKFLIEKLAFEQESDGSFRRGDEKFASLADARLHFLKAEVLAPSGQGRSRRSTKLDLPKDEVLTFRLWTALAPAVFPTNELDCELSSEAREGTGSDVATATTRSREPPTTPSGMPLAGDKSIPDKILLPSRLLA